MSPAHTPAPWEAVGNLVRTVRTADGRGGFLVAECPANIGRRIEDARLIAAAPELLEALEALLNALPSAATHPAIKMARAAMAKATGEQP